MQDDQYFKRLGERENPKRGFKVEGEVLYRKIKEEWKEVVLKFKKEALLNLYHNNMKARHIGTRKMDEKIKEKYFWPGLQENAQEWVKSCEICQKYGKRDPKVPSKKIIIGQP